MNETHSCIRSSAVRAGLSYLLCALGAGISFLLAGCGGSADAPPPPASGTVVPMAVAPTITLQPAGISVTTGQPASFSVAASGTSPIAWQWQRNGTAIAGATSTTYTVATTAMSDSGAVFDAIATNVAGSATSDNATLTVTAAAPVLTITQQPADASVVAGATASFAVAATCSSGTLDVQWQRSNDAGATFAPVVGATAATDAFMAGTGDDGAQFRAVLDCSGQSAVTSGSAALTVSAPSSLTLSELPLTGLRAQADVHDTQGIVEDNLYSFSLIASNRIKRLSADLSTITTVAGSGATGVADGPGATASFMLPQGITHDVSGALYVTDLGAFTIRRIATDGTVSTLAGSAGQQGVTDGTGSAASFYQPFGIAIGPDGDLYVADADRIRRVTTAGVVTTYAGGGSAGADVGGPAASVHFSQLVGIAVSTTGDVYVSDNGYNRVFLVARTGGIAGPAGNVSTIAGDGTNGVADGVGTAAQIGSPNAMGFKNNVLSVGDGSEHIRQIDLTTLAVTTLSGSSNVGGNVGRDGTAATARYMSLRGIVPSTASGLVVSDNASLRRVDTTGAAVTIATSAVDQVNDTGLGTLLQLPFSFASVPPGLVVEPGQSVVVSGAEQLRRISPTGLVSLVAGLPNTGDGAVDGQASGAEFADAMPPIARDASGTLYAADRFGVRKVAADGTVSFIAGSPTVSGQSDGIGSAATFHAPAGIALGPNGDLFVSDLYEIRRVTPAGVVTTYAGSGTGGQVDGPVASARFIAPTQLAFAPDGSLDVVDGNVVRTISADGQQVSTVSGPVVPGLSGGSGIAVDSNGTLYYSGGVGSQLGLHQRTAAGVDSLLIPQGSSVVLGTSPITPVILTIAVYGPKQLLLAPANQGQFYVLTLP